MVPTILRKAVLTKRIVISQRAVKSVLDELRKVSSRLLALLPVISRHGSSLNS